MPTKSQASFRIITGPQALGTPLEANKAYFELRISDQFLRYKKEYWQGFIPLTLVLSEFQYDGQRRSVPFVVGPKLLEALEDKLEGDEWVRYRNTRVAGPIPYRGDDVSIFVGLFRAQTGDNWARQALSFLESIVKVFDVSRLSNYLKITDPLMDAIEGFLGIGDQMELRVGQRESFTDPASNPFNALTPGYYVLLPQDPGMPHESFWMKDNQLHVGEDERQLTPYMDQDYVLYQIIGSKTRNDYTGFEFHKQWEKVQEQIWQGNEKTAKDNYLNLVGLIRRNPDLIPEQMNKLSLYYKGLFEAESAIYRNFMNPEVSVRASVDNALNKSSERMDSTEEFADVAQPIQEAKEYVQDKIIPKISQEGRKPVTETDIQEALKSEPLNSKSVISVDPDKLATGLRLETASL